MHITFSDDLGLLRYKDRKFTSKGSVTDSDIEKKRERSPPRKKRMKLTLPEGEEPAPLLPLFTLEDQQPFLQTISQTIQEPHPQAAPTTTKDTLQDRASLRPDHRCHCIQVESKLESKWKVTKLSPNFLPIDRTKFCT